MDWSHVMLPADKPTLYDLQREERVAEYERAGWEDFERAAREHSEHLAREARVPFWVGLVTLLTLSVVVIAALVELG